jgi:transposase
LDIKAGTVIGRCQRRHRSVEFRAFLDTIEASVPADAEVHVVLDNAATHKTRIVQDWLVKREHFHLHFTPTSASPRQPPGCRPFRKRIVRLLTNDGSTWSSAGSPC